MHLVDEQDGLRAVADESAPRAGEHVTHVLHPRCHRRQLLERAPRLTGDDGRQRGLAHAGRSEHDDGARRGQRPLGRGIRQTPQWGALTQHMGLPQHLVDRPRPHAHGQRSRHIVGHIRRPEQIILSHAYTLQHSIEHRFDTGQTTPSRFAPAPAGGGRRRQSLVTA